MSYRSLGSDEVTLQLSAGRSPERQYITQRPAAGVSLTFINPASSVVFGYGFQAANPAKYDFFAFLFQP
jgi:hypothetical protein